MSYSIGSWGDLLISHDGNTIVSDDSGNMLSYGDEKTFTWKHGRELSGMSDASGSWTFEYNADGLRVYRSDGTTEYKYYYNGDKLTRMVVNGEKITFGYDANGTPQYVLYDGNRYFYLTNLQGDVTAIVSVNGNIVVEYTYDAWGNVLSIDGVRADNLGKLNPLRYRGYVYNEETGLYYLQSRYYDPAIGRFINADVCPSTGQGMLGNNMFAYCSNNPVYRRDSSGFFWESALDVVSLGASIIEVAINPSDVWAWAGLVGDAVDLVPFVTGVGEITRALKTVDKADDVVDAAKALRATNSVASDARSAYGSYEILYSSGKNYIGKGGFDRAIASATRNAGYDKITGIATDPVISIRWKSAPSERDAFIDEYLMQRRYGGVLKSNEELLTYNEIWSPGRRYYGH